MVHMHLKLTTTAFQTETLDINLQGRILGNKHC